MESAPPKSAQFILRAFRHRIISAADRASLKNIHHTHRGTHTSTSLMLNGPPPSHQIPTQWSASIIQTPFPPSSGLNTRLHPINTQILCSHNSFADPDSKPTSGVRSDAHNIHKYVQLTQRCAHLGFGDAVPGEFHHGEVTLADSSLDVIETNSDGRPLPFRSHYRDNTCTSRQPLLSILTAP